MRPIPPAAADQFEVFALRQAIRSGWTVSALRHATAAGTVVRVRRGVYAEAFEPTEDPFADRLRRFRREAAAVSLANRRVPVSHYAAAALHGLWLADDPGRVCVTYPRGGRDPIDGVHRHRGRVRPQEVVGRGPVTMLSPARTVFDVACEHGADAGVVCADSALRFGLALPADLTAAAEGRANWPGARAADLVLPLADPRSESVLESISRLRMVQAGLPVPQPQTDILTPDGRWLGRLDFYWDEFGVGGEADGLDKYRRRGSTPLGEKIRQGPMEDHGVIFVRWGWDIRAKPAPVVARLTAAFARGCRPDRTPRRFLARPTSAWPRVETGRAC